MKKKNKAYNIDIIIHKYTRNYTINLYMHEEKNTKHDS